MPGNIGSFAILLICTLSAASAHASAYLLKKGARLSSTRAALLHAGWKPVITDVRDASGGQEKMFGDARSLFQAGYTEVEFCSGIAPNICFFNYKKKGRCLRLTTRGEYHPNFNAEPMLLRWTNECSKK